MIYLDHNATTPVAPEVLEAMLPFLQNQYGNPSSAHAIGRQAKRAIETAREQLAALINAKADEIIFTGSGTEANSLALFGLDLNPNQPIVTSNIEHSAMAAPVVSLGKQGYATAYIHCGKDGKVALDTPNRAQITSDCQWFGLMLANNESGVCQDVASWAAFVKAQSRAHVHCDAIQAVGKIAVDFQDLGVDSMSVSAHKFYAPKGVGALAVKAGKLAKPFLLGGSQEGGWRAGTYNVASIVGMGKAAELAKSELARRIQNNQAQQQQLRQALAGVPQFQFYTAMEDVLPNTVLMSLKGMTGATLAIKLDCRGIAVGTGAACSNTDAKGIPPKDMPLYNGSANKILMAMQVPELEARGALRVSFGRDTRSEDITALVQALVDIANGLPSI